MLKVYVVVCIVLQIQSYCKYVSHKWSAHSMIALPYRFFYIPFSTATQEVRFESATSHGSRISAASSSK